MTTLLKASFVGQSPNILATAYVPQSGDVNAVFTLPSTTISGAAAVCAKESSDGSYLVGTAGANAANLGPTASKPSTDSPTGQFDLYTGTGTGDEGGGLLFAYASSSAWYRLYARVLSGGVYLLLRDQSDSVVFNTLIPGIGTYAWYTFRAAFGTGTVSISAGPQGGTISAVSALQNVSVPGLSLAGKSVGLTVVNYNTVAYGNLLWTEASSASAFSASADAATNKQGGTTVLTVTPNGALGASETVTITDDLGNTLGTLNFASGATAAQTLNIVWASGQVGARTITATPSPSLGTAPTSSVTVYNLALTPSSQSDIDTQAVNLTATLAGGTGTLTASVSGGGTLSTTSPTSGAAFTYTAPSSGSGTATITVTGPGATSSSATVAYAPGIIIALDQSNQTVNEGGVVTVNATVTNAGSGSTSVTWSGTALANCAGSGNQRVFTAPSAAGTYTLTATSVADNTKTVSVVFTVLAVVISFASIAVCQLGSTATIAPAVVTGATNTSVTYAQPDGGTYSAGTFTPPTGAANGQTFRIVATSQGDTTKTATCTVTMAQTFAYPASISLGVASLPSVTVQVDGGSGYGAAMALAEELDGTARTGVYSTTLNLAYTTQYRLRFSDGQGNYVADTVYRASPIATVGAYSTGKDPASMLKADSDFAQMIADTNGAFTFAVPSTFPGNGTLTLKDKAGINTLLTITLGFDSNKNVISRSVA